MDPAGVISSCTCQNARQKFRQSHSRLSHGPLPTHRATFLPLYLCNPVASNSFTIYRARHSLQRRDCSHMSTCYSVWLLLCDSASVACPLWAAMCPGWQKAIVSPPHRPRSIWRGADDKWTCQASTSPGILGHSREDPLTVLQDEKGTRIIIVPSTWL